MWIAITEVLVLCGMAGSVELLRSSLLLYVTAFLSVMCLIMFAGRRRACVLGLDGTVALRTGTKRVAYFLAFAVCVVLISKQSYISFDEWMDSFLCAIICYYPWLSGSRAASRRQSPPVPAH